MPVVESPLHISKVFLAVRVGALVLTLVVLCLVCIPFFIKIVLFSSLLAYAFYSWNSYPHYQFLVTDGQLWELRSSQGVIRGVLRGDSMVTAWLIVLRLTVPEKRRPVSCVLFVDAVSAEAWRQMRVLAYYGK